jgi:hypothetical protein
MQLSTGTIAPRGHAPKLRIQWQQTSGSKSGLQTRYSDGSSNNAMTYSDAFKNVYHQLTGFGPTSVRYDPRICTVIYGNFKVSRTLRGVAGRGRHSVWNFIKQARRRRDTPNSPLLLNHPPPCRTRLGRSTGLQNGSPDPDTIAVGREPTQGPEDLIWETELPAREYVLLALYGYSYKNLIGFTLGKQSRMARFPALFESG